MRRGDSYREIHVKRKNDQHIYCDDDDDDDDDDNF